MAQHATATCYPQQGHQLDRDERAYLVEVIGRWIDRELANSIEGRDSESSTSRRS